MCLLLGVCLPARQHLRNAVGGYALSGPTPPSSTRAQMSGLPRCTPSFSLRPTAYFGESTLSSPKKLVVPDWPALLPLFTSKSRRMAAAAAAASVPSQTTRIRAFMARIEECGVCDSIHGVDEKLFNDLLELCKFHPDEERRIPRDLRIQVSKWGKLQLMEFNGEAWNSISVVACVKQKGWTDAKTVSNGLRAEIEEQICAFREEPGQCAACSEADGEEVDHVRPFSELTKEFLKSHPLSAEGVVKDVDADKPRLSDRDLAQSWKEFHEENAKLQWLCRACHAEKTAASRTAGCATDS